MTKNMKGAALHQKIMALKPSPSIHSESDDYAEGYVEASKKIYQLEDAIHLLKNWSQAYPTDVFPEPDFEKAAKVLKENGMTLDSISASNMRHVLSGVREILKEL